MGSFALYPSIYLWQHIDSVKNNQVARQSRWMLNSSPATSACSSDGAGDNYLKLSLAFGNLPGLQDYVSSTGRIGTGTARLLESSQSALRSLKA